MPWSIEILAGLALLLGTGCTLSKSKSSPDPAEETQVAPTYLDWQPVEDRLSGHGVPVDRSTRDQIDAHKRAIQGREHELEEWIVPLLTSYLPRGERLTGRVVFGVGRPQPIEITPNGIAYIDVTYAEWKTDSLRLWTETVAALYRCALTQALPDRVDQPVDAESFADAVLARLMVDGLATYVTAQGAPVAKGSTPDAALMIRDEKSERFQLLEAYMAESRDASPQRIQDLWREIRETEPSSRLLGIAGATMAEAIEARTSRVVLMDTVSEGHRAFYDEYMEGRPGALLSFRLPPEAVAPLEWPDSAH